MDANKKFNLLNPHCPNESKILTNIRLNHPLSLSIVGSASVPWIYMYQFWHTLLKYGSRYQFRFSLGTKELMMNVVDFKRIFQLPQATDNNHIGFVDAPTFEALEAEDLDHLLEGNKNVSVDEFMNDTFNSQEDPDTMIEPRSDKESLEMETDADMVHDNTNKEQEELVGDEFKLKRRKKGKGIEETGNTPSPTPIRSPRTHIAPLSTDKETL
nr:hypothetical protein [Tanacetum cinerariifolium]